MGHREKPKSLVFHSDPGGGYHKPYRWRSLVTFFGERRTPKFRNVNVNAQNVKIDVIHQNHNVIQKMVTSHPESSTPQKSACSFIEAHEIQFMFH